MTAGTCTERRILRVLWTHNFPEQIGSAGSFMYTSAAGLRSLGVSVDLLQLQDLSSPRGVVRAMAEIRRRAAGYDLVHAQFGSACGFVTAVSDARVVVSLRGSDWHRYGGPALREAWHARLAGRLSRMALRRARAAVTMSDRMTGEVRAMYPELTVRRITDPIDTRLFVPHDRIESRRRLFGTCVTDPWVLFTSVSRSNPVKRVWIAEEAVRLAAQRMPGLVLKVATGIPHQDMPYFVSACDVALCTSTHEGWPNSIKEALACGVPFVATDVSDLASVARRHASCRVTAADPEQLALAILDALQSPRDSGLRSEITSMSVEEASRELVGLYESILSSRSAAAGALCQGGR